MLRYWRALMTQSHLFFGALFSVIVLLNCLFSLVQLILTIKVILFVVYPVVKLVLFHLLLILNIDVFLLAERQRIHLRVMVSSCIDEISRLLAPRLYYFRKIFYWCHHLRLINSFLLLFLRFFEDLPNAYQEIFIGQDLHVAHFRHRLLNWQLNLWFRAFCESLLWHQSRLLSLRHNLETHEIILLLFCSLGNWCRLSAISQWSKDLDVCNCWLDLARPWRLFFATCRRLFEDRTWQRKHLDWICEL